jgi:hypothetical protein
VNGGNPFIRCRFVATLWRYNGRTRIDLLVAQVSNLRHFLQSTPERRSALLLGEGSQPVTFILWQEVAAPRAARLLFSINVNALQLCARIIAEVSAFGNDRVSQAHLLSGQEEVVVWHGHNRLGRCRILNVNTFLIDPDDHDRMLCQTLASIRELAHLHKSDYREIVV